MILSLGGHRPVLDGDAHFVADNAAVIGNVRLRAEASVWFNSVLRGDNELIDVGERSNVQDGSILHTDIGFPLTVGRGVTIGHKVMLHGCSIDENSLIGIGSIILNGARIARDCIVGAGALVTEGKTFPAGSLILGTPARVARSLTDEEIASIREASDHYVENARRYLEQLKALE